MLAMGPEIHISSALGAHVSGDIALGVERCAEVGEGGHIRCIGGRA